MAVYKNSVPFGNIVTDGLVLNLDATNINSYPGSGTTWTDTSFYRNSGSLVNGPTFLRERGRGSIVFDGIDDYVNFGSSLGNSFNQITICCWARPTTFPNTTFVFEKIVAADDNSSSGLESVFSLDIAHNNNPTNLPIEFKGNSIYFGIRTGTQTNRSRPIGIPDFSFAGGLDSYIAGCAISVNPSEYAINTWMFLCGVYTGTQTFLYINGNLKATSNLQPDGVSRNLSGSLNTSTISRNIASTSVGSFFTGNISTTQIYNRALSAQEVQQNYNALKSRFGL